ncbi:MAG TPA: serine/threonine-protein kinase, partial [Pyrinomonadaceae bacterium]|nr:serine/threonine-protein kinase [Pyrinomonadaceae bacterium]
MASLAKGEIIDDTYEVLFFIGEGAFGETYRVKHKFLGTQVLKLFKEKYVQETDITIVTKEARLLSKITHPNIVRVFETNSFSKNGKNLYYLTMGFVSGETLGQLVARKGPLLIPLAISIQKDILTGLQCVQEQPSTIVHRDINPDNILISYEKNSPVSLIADFGLAQSMDQLSNLPGAAGRYPYFAPECFFGAYLPSSDIFSAGIVFYQMITGRHPWDYDLNSAGEDHDKLITAILSARKCKVTKPSVYNAACSAELDRIILKALSKNLGKRYKLASAFLDELNEYERAPRV